MRRGRALSLRKAISRQIAAIRRVLAQVPGGERWIETLVRRGYRFVGPVAELRDDAAKADTRVPRSNLPAAVTSFVGRERELVEIKRLLPGKRLVTFVGMGGIGKTRLALQVAAGSGGCLPRRRVVRGISVLFEIRCWRQRRSHKCLGWVPEAHYRRFDKRPRSLREGIVALPS